ncbi:MAG: YkgJ family cysteine cluster protein [Desulfurococcales archaeon]|nr:YkgJ family cysteine cluster protein [Desulfurococcales archaeon]
MPKFQCFRCLHCCFFSSEDECPVVLPREKRRLEELAEAEGVELTFRKVGNEGLYRWVIKGYCPFYDVRSRGCRIYEERPLACRMFPLLLNPKTGEVSVSRACDWVVANFGEIMSGDPKEVFPEELNAALTVFKELRKQ